MKILIFDTHRRVSAIISPFKFMQCHSSEEANKKHMLEANKKQVRLKSYSVEMRTDSINQILKNKEKVTQTRNICILTRITDRKIQCVYIRVN